MTRSEIAKNASIAAGNRRKSAANMAIKKLSAHYTSSPEADLFFCIISRAIIDLYNEKRKKKEHQSASKIIGMENYFTKGDIVHAELIGLDSEYVVRVLKKCGII